VNAEHLPLTNAKGAFKQSLGEFVALGMLYHTKRVEFFMQKKAESKWEPGFIQLV